MVIVGGGPIGLMFGILLKTNPITKDLYDITILEKRREYTREQILLVTADAYNLLPEEIKYNIWIKDNHPGCYVLPPSKDNWVRCYIKKLPLASVTTRLLETELLNYVMGLGIDVVQSGNIIINNDDIMVDGVNVNYDIVVGADGTNSLVRSKMLQSDVIREFEPMWGVTVIFPPDIKRVKTYQKATKGRITTSQNTPDQNRYRVFRDRRGSVYIGLIVSREKYDLVVRSIADKTPIPKWLSDEIMQLCKTFKIDKCIVPTIDNTSAFPVIPTYSRVYSKLTPKPVYLIGDALANTNFFTGSGFNAGVIMGKNLADLLAKYPDGRIPVSEYIETQKPQILFINNRIRAFGQKEVHV